MPFQHSGIAMFDLDGRTKYANTFLCDLLGMEFKDIEDRPCFDFVFPEDIGAAMALFEANKLPDAKPFRFRLRRNDGAAVWVRVQGGTMTSPDGQMYGIMATVTPEC
jgi:PAS domain S-box-containing protein